MKSKATAPHRAGVKVSLITTGSAQGFYQIVCPYCTNQWIERGDEEDDERGECACNGGKAMA